MPLNLSDSLWRSSAKPFIVLFPSTKEQTSAKIGTSSIQSRALAVLINKTYVFCLPGSKGACKDGWDQILVHQLDSTHKPCNLVELMPRLLEK